MAGLSQLGEWDRRALSLDQQLAVEQGWLLSPDDEIGIAAQGDPAAPGGDGDTADGGGGAGAGACAGQQARSRTGTAALTAEEKLERARALNRAKQARFRQRQKEKREELEQRFEQAGADLERERQANAAMKLTASVLEAMQQHKDQAAEMLEAAAAEHPSGQQLTSQGPAVQRPGPSPPALLQDATDTEPSSSAAAAPSAASGLVAGSSSLAAPGSTDDDAGIGERFRALCFADRVELCTQIFQTVEPARRTLRHLGKDADSFGLGTDVKRALGDHMVAAQPQLLTAALSMTPEDILQDFSGFGELTAEVVRAVDGGRTSEVEAEHRMRPAVLYQAVRNAILLSYKPDTVLHLMQHTRLPGESEGEAAARWRQVMLDMGVTKEGALLCLPLYQAYGARMQRVRQEAATSLASMQEVQQSLDVQLGELGDASLRSLVHQSLDLFEAARRLQQLPTASLLALMDFHTAVGASVTPMQKTRMIAACRPLYPDVVQIVKEGLAHHGLLPPPEG